MAKTDELQTLNTLAEGFPYPPPMAGEGVVFVDQNGACDPLMREQYQRESPFRYATAFFRFTRDAVTGALQLQAQTLTLFQNGANQTGAGTGGTTGNTVQTRAETNAFSQGGVAKQGNRFIGVGLMITPLAPFTVATDADAIGPNSTRTRPAWFDGGTNYPAELLALLNDSVTALAQHGEDNACSYDFGPLAFWVNQTPQAGYKPSLGVPGQFTFLAVPDVSGNNQDGYNLQVTLTVNEGLEVLSDPVNPTVAGVDVVVPVRFSLVGFPICVEGGTVKMNGAACGVKTSPDDIADKAAEIAERLLMKRMRALGMGDQAAPVETKSAGALRGRY